MSGNTSKPARAVALARVQALISGLEKHLPGGSFSVGGTSTTTASLVQLFQSLIDAMTAVDKAHVTLKDALAALHQAETTVGPTMMATRRIVQGMFAGVVATLGDFGLQPPKAHKPLTTEQRAAAKAKAAATRKARGTTSKKQKLAIHGDVQGVTITPLTESQANAPPQQQAPKS
jgi:hypothetical protein